MPKYREERQLKAPVPGAFGLGANGDARDMDLWQLTQRQARYRDRLYIFVEEEYGYASYLWTYPGTPEELVDDWCAGRVPWSGPLDKPLYRGEFNPAAFHTHEANRGMPYPRSLELRLTETNQVVEGFSHISHFDGIAHYHEEDDSHLRVGFYEVNGFRKPEVVFHVLDALAAIT